MLLKNNLLKSLIVACAASSAIASPVAHLHHAHKRDVVHVTETVVVTVGGDNTDFAAAPAATLATIEAEPTEGTQTVNAYSVTVLKDSVATDAAATDATVKKFEAQAAAETTSSEASTETTQAASSNDDSSSSSSSNFNGGSKGITYSPYNNDGSCKDLNSVKSDFEKLTGYELIRLYGVDCNQVANVFQAKGSNQKLFLGIFYVDQIADGVDTLASAVSSYGSWDDVHTVSIGNELVNSGAYSPSQIGSLVSSGKSLLSAKGYSGPVVSVDTHVAIINNPELCQYSDYIAFNAHAYWDGTVTGSDAGPWLLLQMQRVWSACGGKDVLCTESGWPHAGDANGVAIASRSEQQAAISSIDSTCGGDTIVFTPFDDMWKNPGSKNCEQYWGIF